MTADIIREAVHAVPFLPFTIRMADGHSHHVPHPDFIAITGPGNYLAVSNPANDSTAFVDVSLITQLVVDPLHVRDEE